ncbi:oligosaccharide repeat unit polymerase [Novosphingobium sp. ERW19]|nr:O-antigen polymerase [Novosphingobium sp. ERW19]NLR41492.1 oligosaccharide repeat unit polymerase [Novosphingobium sp. ERW19]
MFLSLVYFAFFGVTPIISEPYMLRSLMKVIQISTIFLTSAVISTLIILFTGRRLIVDFGPLPAKNVNSMRDAGLAVYMLSAAVFSAYLATHGIPWLAENPNLARHEFVSNAGYFQIFMTRGMPVGAICICASELARKNRIITPLSGAIIISWLVLTFLQGFRIHLMMAILYLLMLYFYSTRKMSLTRFAFIAALISAIFITISLIRFENDSSVNITEIIQHRIGFELLWATNYSVQLSEIQGLWWGKTIFMDLYSALPGPGESFGDYLLNFANPRSDIVGLAALTPSVLSEAYLNFGNLGVLIFGAMTPIMFVPIHKLIGFQPAIGRTSLVIVPILLAQVVEVGIGQTLASRILPTVAFLLILGAVYRMQLGLRLRGRTYRPTMA